MTENSLSAADKMHGSIFVFLRRFFETKYDYSTWQQLLATAGIDHAPYTMHEMYPTREIYDILMAASNASGTDSVTLQEAFGEFLVPDLLLIYKKYIDPSWKTYDMLLHTESNMHAAVKKEDERTSPPKLMVTKIGTNKLMVDYHSKRRMGPVAIGIIKGIARYYNEHENVKVTSISAPHEERVQIAVDFTT